jgi:hypothetical protein
MASIARVGIGVYCCVYWGILVYIVSVRDGRVRDCGEIEGHDGFPDSRAF